MRPLIATSDVSAPKRSKVIGLAQIEFERTRRFGGEERTFGKAVEQKQRHAERPGRHHDAGEVADDRATYCINARVVPGAGCRASQCRTGTIAIRNRPIAISTACEGSASSVRAPSAAAGMPVTE